MSDQEKTVEPQSEERPRGDKGELGEATAALTLKQKYHEAHFKREDAGDKHNPHKRVWVKLPGAPSLKVFARLRLREKDPVAQQWFANKKGAKNATRSDANIKAAKEAAFATRTERRKRSANKK